MTIATPRPAAEAANRSKTLDTSGVPVAKQMPVKSLAFTGQQGFRKEMNRRVEAFLSANKLRQRDIPAMYVKSALVLGMWLAGYALFLYAGANFHWALALLAAVFFGQAAACVGFNIMHDANHGGYSDNPKINRWFGMTIELVGLSSFIWRQQHNVWHHTYTNIAGLDEGLETDGWLRSSPKDIWKPLHRFQHLYAPLVYAMSGIGLLIFRNYTVYFTGRSGSHFVYPKMRTQDKLVFWGFRAFNVLMYFVLPFVFMPWPVALAGVVIALFTAGSVLAHVLMLAHIHDELAFVEPVGDPLRIENEWAIHQVVTTMNFAQANRMINWYVGGLNFQIEHHLFPQMCHLVYPRIAPLVREVCAEFGVRYQTDASFWHAIAEHYRSLKVFGRQPAH
jgi:linoleoyl-CoA desaturase